jgi:hypothetical protein
MKKLYFLNEEESNRILNLHRTAIKKTMLNEAGPYQDTETVSTPSTTPTSASTIPTSASTTPTSSSTTPTSSSTTPTGTLVQQLQTLIGVTSDGKFGPKSLQGLKDKLKSTPASSPTSGTTATSGTTVTTATSGTTETPGSTSINVNNLDK